MEKIEAVRLLHELKEAGYLTMGEFDRKVSEVLDKRGLIKKKPSDIEQKTPSQRLYQSWSSDEDAYLKTHYHNTRTKEISKALGRKIHSCYNRAGKLGLRK